MPACAFCGRDNVGESRFCLDCGKPLNPSAARIIPSPVPAGAGALAPSPAARGTPAARATAPASHATMRTGTCPHCGGRVDPALPFCPHCGARVSGAAPAGATSGGTAVLSAQARQGGVKLAVLDEAGQPAQTFTLANGEAIVGRVDGDLRFPNDVYLSPVHAQFALKDGALVVRDLGSRNGTWVFVERAHKFTDGDVALVGSQLLRFRRLGYPGPHPPEADATRRLGSLTPTADIAVLAQLRADGSVRDTFHLSPGRTIFIGRERGDWLFPYDQTMSGRHAEVRSEDSDFVLLDAGSRNGVAVAVRGEKPLALGHRVLLGDQTLRVEQL